MWTAAQCSLDRFTDGRQTEAVVRRHQPPVGRDTASGGRGRDVCCLPTTMSAIVRLRGRGGAFRRARHLAVAISCWQWSSRWAEIRDRHTRPTADVTTRARGALHDSPQHSEIATAKFDNRKKIDFFKTIIDFWKKTKLTSLDCAASKAGHCAAWQLTNNWLGVTDMIRLWLERAFSAQYFRESNARQTKTRTNI